MAREVFTREEVLAMSDEDVGALSMTGRTFEELKADWEEVGVWEDDGPERLAFIGAAFKRFEGTLHKPASGLSRR